MQQGIPLILASTEILLKGCQIYGFTSTVAALSEIWSLAAVSCDRLQAIFNPLDSQKRITKSQVSHLILYLNLFRFQYSLYLIYFHNVIKFVDS